MRIKRVNIVEFRRASGTKKALRKILTDFILESVIVALLLLLLVPN